MQVLGIHLMLLLFLIRYKLNCLDHSEKLASCLSGKGKKTQDFLQVIC
jgi:hypothetical protein